MLTAKIFDVKKFAIHDGPGLRLTVFFHGCPLACQWCHNPEAWQTAGCDSGMRSREVGVDDLMRELVKDELFYNESGGGVTFSGGEPLMQPDFLSEMLRQCHDYGWHTAVDTSGLAPRSVVEQVAPLADRFLFDIKLVDPEAHQRYTGADNRQILDNLRYLVGAEVDLQLRVPLIPGITATASNLAAILSLMQSLPRLRRVALLPYNRLGVDKARRFGLTNRPLDLPSFELAETNRLAQPFKDAGYHVSIGG